MRFVCTGVIAALLSCSAASGIRAQDDASTIDFGKGVHAYFAGQLNAAESFFTQAIGTGTIDPRPYYFRGLTRELLGQSKAGLQDFQKGSEVEASPAGRAFDVASSLERVQGKPRVQLEQIRREVLARLRPQVQREADGMVEFEANRKLARATTDSGGNLDPRSLPGVDTLIDPTIPFESTDATVPPPNLVDPNAQPAEMVDDSVPPPSTPPASKPSSGDDPFGDSGGGKSTPPASGLPPASGNQGTGDDAPAPPPKPADKKSEDDPFGG